MSAEKLLEKKTPEKKNDAPVTATESKAGILCTVHNATTRNLFNVFTDTLQWGLNSLKAGIGHRRFEEWENTKSAWKEKWVRNTMMAAPKTIKNTIIGGVGTGISMFNPMNRYRTMKKVAWSVAETAGNPFARFYNSRNSDVEYEKHMLQPIPLPKS